MPGSYIYTTSFHAQICVSLCSDIRQAKLMYMYTPHHATTWCVSCKIQLYILSRSRLAICQSIFRNTKHPDRSIKISMKQFPRCSNKPRDEDRNHIFPNFFFTHYLSKALFVGLRGISPVATQSTHCWSSNYLQAKKENFPSVSVVECLGHLLLRLHRCRSSHSLRSTT